MLFVFHSKANRKKWRDESARKGEEKITTYPYNTNLNFQSGELRHNTKDPDISISIAQSQPKGSLWPQLPRMATETTRHNAELAQAVLRSKETD